jgi:hypothetical protein
VPWKARVSPADRRGWDCPVVVLAQTMDEIPLLAMSLVRGQRLLTPTIVNLNFLWACRPNISVAFLFNVLGRLKFDPGVHVVVDGVLLDWQLKRFAAEYSVPLATKSRKYDAARTSVAWPLKGVVVIVVLGVSLRLAASDCVSLRLAAFRCVSLCLAASRCVSLRLAASRGVLLRLTASRFVSLRPANSM